VGVEIDIEWHRATTLVCGAKKGKDRFQRMVAGMRRDGTRDTVDHLAQRRKCGKDGKVFHFGIVSFFVSDFLS
jgi:hypothetical protein